MHISRTKTASGFSLIELLITLGIIGIITSIAYPAYTDHIAHVRRTQAEAALLCLAAKLEQYYEENNSYKDANWENLGIKEFTDGNFYHLKISMLGGDAFQISAEPLGIQAKIDRNCGSLILDQAGEKRIGGPGEIRECWQ